jgi:hypothetical protein
MTVSIMTLSISFRHYGIIHDGCPHYSKLCSAEYHNLAHYDESYAENSFVECHYAESHYTACHFTDCRYAECNKFECLNGERH